MVVLLFCGGFLKLVAGVCVIMWTVDVLCPVNPDRNKSSALCSIFCFFVLKPFLLAKPIFCLVKQRKKKIRKIVNLASGQVLLHWQSCD